LTTADSHRDERYHASRPKRGISDTRTPAERDRDRILYSSAFRRLAEGTQVVSPTIGYVFHNRLTHSLQVAQVGRRLAERLRGTHLEESEWAGCLDPDVVEAACLAHDLVHPPFGHIAEEELNALTTDYGGFEGNAQSFRILTKLAFHSENHRGLNLTRATLAGVLKYPWLRNENPLKPKKWGAYETERPDFDFATALCSRAQVRTLEADLMDWADDVTYSVHDIEDFYKAGRIPAHLLSHVRDSGERKTFFDDVFRRRKNNPDFADRARLEEAFTDVMLSNFALEEQYIGKASQRAALRVFTSNLIGRYINGVKIVSSGDETKVAIDPGLQSEVAMLKELVWTYVIEAPALATQQYGQRKIIRELFAIYTDAANCEGKRKIFPAYYRERLDATGSGAQEICRICVDLIASLTEAQVINMHQRLTGSSLGSALEDLVI
jgi:dGTPase